MSPRISIRLLAAQPDERLVALAREGHERAFEALVRRYRRPLLRYCHRLHLSDARAEDVVQQALMKAWQALARGAEVREPRAWLYRIVHNAAVNTIRGAREIPTEPAGVLREDATGESELERTLAVRDALGHVAALPAMQRDAVLLTAVDGQSHDEVASSLGVSQGAVRGLLYRARTTLRSATAALTPAPLLEWASRGADTAAPSAERIAELTTGVGAAGMAGVLVKGAAVAVSVGALATGVAVVKLRHGAGGHAHAARHAAVRSADARVSASVAPAAAVAAPGGIAPASGASSRSSSALAGHGSHKRRHMPGGVSGAARHGGAPRLLAYVAPPAPPRPRRGSHSDGGAQHEDRHFGTPGGRQRDGGQSEGPTNDLESSRQSGRDGSGGGEAEPTGSTSPTQSSGSGESGSNGSGSGGPEELAQASSTSSDDSHNDGEEPAKTSTGSGERPDN